MFIKFSSRRAIWRSDSGNVILSNFADNGPRPQDENGDIVYRILTELHPKDKADNSTLQVNIANVIKELTALYRVFTHSRKYYLRNRDIASINPESDELKLRPGAGMYLCWYSQLRDLLQRYPGLSGNIGVLPLPAGGFRGDWFLGIVKGSVSIGLGYDILKILCGKTEEFKRFVRGVGLPVTKRFENEKGSGSDFYAGPFSTIQLKEIFTIYRRAFTRSAIKDYREYRTFLYSIGQQLSFLPPENEIKNGKNVKNEKNAKIVSDFIAQSVARIPGIIKDVLTEGQ